jgi:hypothetical protein
VPNWIEIPSAKQQFAAKTFADQVAEIEGCSNLTPERIIDYGNRRALNMPATDFTPTERKELDHLFESAHTQDGKGIYFASPTPEKSTAAKISEKLPGGKKRAGKVATPVPPPPQPAPEPDEPGDRPTDDPEDLVGQPDPSTVANPSLPPYAPTPVSTPEPPAPPPPEPASENPSVESINEQLDSIGKTLDSASDQLASMSATSPAPAPILKVSELSSTNGSHLKTDDFEAEIAFRAKRATAVVPGNGVDPLYVTPIQPWKGPPPGDPRPTILDVVAGEPSEEEMVRFFLRCSDERRADYVRRINIVSERTERYVNILAAVEVVVARRRNGVPASAR